MVPRDYETGTWFQTWRSRHLLRSLPHWQPSKSFLSCWAAMFSLPDLVHQELRIGTEFGQVSFLSEVNSETFIYHVDWKSREAGLQKKEEWSIYVKRRDGSMTVQFIVSVSSWSLASFCLSVLWDTLYPYNTSFFPQDNLISYLHFYLQSQ